MFVTLPIYYVLYHLILNILLHNNGLEKTTSFVKSDIVLLITIVLSVFTYINFYYSLDSFHLNELLTFTDSYRSLAIDYGWFIFIGLTLFLVSLAHNLFVSKDNSIKLLFILASTLYSLLFFFNILSVLPQNSFTESVWNERLHVLVYILVGIEIGLLIINIIYKRIKKHSFSILLQVLGIFLLLLILVSRAELFYTEYPMETIYDFGFTNYSLFGLVFCTFSYNVVLLYNLVNRLK